MLAAIGCFDMSITAVRMDRGKANIAASTWCGFTSTLASKSSAEIFGCLTAKNEEWSALRTLLQLPNGPECFFQQLTTRRLGLVWVNECNGDFSPVSKDRRSPNYLIMQPCIVLVKNGSDAERILAIEFVGFFC